MLSGTLVGRAAIRAIALVIVLIALALVYLTMTAFGGLHPSWDVDRDGRNDCIITATCDHTIDYSKPRNGYQQE